ncbi:MAG: ATP-dependent DNA helicase RecQ [Thermoleophilaceae bacterium]|nr:ATP-dependent DNA helicase RecQ [Thermoleophilaceae bacterium]
MSLERSQGADRIEEVAREALGFERLRPGQREAIQGVLTGRDTLAVMSTGSGKSAIYQIAGLVRPGVTLVISPLIALQRDQVESIEERLPGEAAGVNSTVPPSEREEALEELEEGRLEFLFLAPEQLANPEVLERVRCARPSLVVVDEAHCISEWGHDFRPDYLRLGALVEELGHPTVLALTATASPPVREEIAARLRMRDPLVVVRGFDRPNIWLGVERHQDEERKRRALFDAVAAAERPGIVYAPTRALAEELAEGLTARGVPAQAYHAGMGASQRERIQEAFMADRFEVIVATTAFGMGIDKPNIRFVLHHAVADSVDSYYQEIGRAGRDGEPARALLFYRPEDLGLRRFFAGARQVAVDEIARVAEALHERRGPVDPVGLKDELGLSQSKLVAAVNRLEEAGAVRVLASGEVDRPRGAPPLRESVEAAAKLQADRHELDRSRVEMIRSYAEHDGCRRQFLLSYFGEELPEPCGNCDNCEAGLGRSGARAEPFPVGGRVVHPRFGRGVVQRYDDDAVVVLFDTVGYKTLGLELVRYRGLLRPG